jgi:hypothetical protein
MNNNGSLACFPSTSQTTAHFIAMVSTTLKSDELVGDECRRVVEGGLGQIWRWLDFLGRRNAKDDEGGRRRGKRLSVLRYMCSRFFPKFI